jgi:WhiB family transcriptional regulator, redox-sensing transcriptional regulator
MTGSPEQVVTAGGVDLRLVLAVHQLNQLREAMREPVPRAEVAQNAGSLATQELLGDAPDWYTRALCRQADPEEFFPEKGDSTLEAKRTCARCPVKGECLEYSVMRDEPFGIWGGLTERQRRRLKRRVA